MRRPHIPAVRVLVHAALLAISLGIVGTAGAPNLGAGVKVTVAPTAVVSDGAQRASCGVPLLRDDLQQLSRLVELVEEVLDAGGLRGLAVADALPVRNERDEDAQEQEQGQQRGLGGDHEASDWSWTVIDRTGGLRHSETKTRVMWSPISG